MMITAVSLMLHYCMMTHLQHHCDLICMLSNRDSVQDMYSYHAKQHLSLHQICRSFSYTDVCSAVVIATCLTTMHSLNNSYSGYMLDVVWFTFKPHNGFGQISEQARRQIFSHGS